ncbi:MAG: hypothetical protein ABSE73_01135 [Planctomycetota bacterium]
MLLNVHDLAGDKVLASSVRGKRLLADLIAKLQPVRAPEVLGLDFGGVEVATGSFLRESVLAFRDYCRRDQALLYPVVANAAAEVTEELECVLRDRAEALVVCRWESRQGFSEPQVIGVLEEKQRATLEAVVKAGCVDAGALLRQFGKKEGIGITGWNNRLAALAAKGILMESKQGRGKQYKPVLEGLVYGS